MSDRLASPQVSYVAFEAMPLQNEISRAGQIIGNVVRVPTDQLGNFLATANPANLEDFVDRHPEATIYDLGSLATEHARVGEPEEVTATAQAILAETSALIQGLPDGFRADFAGGDTLTIRIV